MNPITDALEILTDALQTDVGQEIRVTRDPAVIGAAVAATNLAVLVGPPAGTEPSSYRTWFLAVPIYVVFPVPGEPRHLDPALTVAQKILDSDYEVLSMDNRVLQLDAGLALPAITVTVRITTEC